MAGASLENGKNNYVKGEAGEGEFARQPSREGALHNHITICIS